MTVDYHPRIIDQQLRRLIEFLPAIAVEGAKGVGKTASLQRCAHEVYSLDEHSTLTNTEADPTLILHGVPPILVDEWQNVPAVWNVVRRAVDDGAAPGQFLLAGSADPSRKARIHSGAGRIVRIVMRPMAFPERAVEEPSISFASLLDGEASGIEGTTTVTTADYVDEILTSGFPGIRSQQADARPYLLDSYLDRIVDRDVPEAGGNVRHPVALRNWLAAYGAATATTATYASILRAATPGDDDGISQPTAGAYRELLRRIWVLDPVPAWEPGFAHLKRLGQTPKHHLADPALAARLVGASAASLMKGDTDPEFPRDGTFLGALFESLVVQAVRVLAGARQATVSHMRTRDGDHEVDIIVQRPDFRFLAIEVKLSTAVRPTDVAQLHWLEKQLPGRMIDKVIINTGSRAFRRPDGVAVIPLALLGL